MEHFDVHVAVRRMVEEGPIPLPSRLELAIPVVLDHAFKQRARMPVAQTPSPASIAKRSRRERQDCSNRYCAGRFHYSTRFAALLLSFFHLLIFVFIIVAFIARIVASGTAFNRNLDAATPEVKAAYRGIHLFFRP